MEFQPLSLVVGLFPNGLYLIAWIVALFFAVRMSRTGGGRAEKFLLIGVSLMLANSVIGTIFTIIQQWVIYWMMRFNEHMGAREMGLIFSAIGGFRGLIALAGIVYLVLAFWKKFKTY
jgi:hypothetical protein